MIRPDDRHQLLTAQHDQLRHLISALRSAAGSVLAAEDAEPVKLVGRLRRAVEELEVQFVAHLATEEAFLERVDAWGPIRLELLQAEHARQRAVLAAMRVAQGAPYRIALRAASLAEDLLADIADEERDLLAPDLRRCNGFGYAGSAGRTGARIPESGRQR
jgi:Hemerythrin HHE cation binding domain